jgi:Do/DeqQ family serine protease
MSSRINPPGGVFGAGIKYILLAAFVAVALVIGHSFEGRTLASTTASLVNAPASASVNSYADVVSRVSPAVVTIHSELRAREAQQFPFMDDPMLRQFFGFGNRGHDQQQQQQPQERRQSALGSGVIVNGDGYILTNYHVIDGAEQVKVDLNDNRTLSAKVIGSDPPSDLAVLKVDASNLPVLQLGNSDDVRVGDVVLAIGNPLGVGQTVTMGIISAKGRQTGLSNGSFEDFLQTDAPINQGNSGGALVNTNGELVGINSQILSQSGGSIGIGFAIPSNMARSVMDQLIKTGKVRRGQLGIYVQKVTSDLASSLGLSEAKGVIVSQVQPGSAAERAGIRQGDVITSVNGTAVNDPNTFRNLVASAQPGSALPVAVERNGQPVQMTAMLGEFKPEKSSSEETAENRQNAPSSGRLGVSVTPLTPDVASQMGLKNANGLQGLVVGDVQANGPAADAGIQRGDIILQVNRQPVHSVAELQAALGHTGLRPTLMLINRDGQNLFLTVRPRQ